MNKYDLNLIVNEVKNFDKLQVQYNYVDLNDLIGHYIEEDVISSRDELKKVLNVLKRKLKTAINVKTFGDCWGTAGQ